MSNLQESQNIMAEEGIDDMDLVDQFDLDPSVAYTPDIHKAVLDSVEQANYDTYIANGYSEAEAQKMAKSMRQRSEEAVEQKLAMRNNK